MSKLKRFLASCVAASMLLAGCGEVEKNKENNDKTKEENKENSVINELSGFEFEGLNKVLGYSSNAFNTINDSLNGNLDTSVSTDVSVLVGSMLTSEIGYDVKEFTISNNAVVKGDKVANDLLLKYDNQTLASLNCIVDGGVAYFRVPELNDAYIKGDIASILESEANGVVGENITFGDSELPEEILTALEAFDNNKITALFDDYGTILKNYIPDAKDGEKISGKINGFDYSYETKDYVITGKIAFDCLNEMLNKVKDDKEIEALWNSVMTTAKEQAYLDDYSEEEIKEEFPTYSEFISNVLTDWEKEKEDAYNSTETMTITLLFDGEKCVGFRMNQDEENLTCAIIDTKDTFAVGYTLNEKYSTTDVGFSVSGSDGKYDGKFAVNVDELADIAEDEEEMNMSFEATFKTDVTVIDEETGAFTGTIEAEIKAGSDSVGYKITSNSTKDKTEIKFDFLVNKEVALTVGLKNVVTNATDITLPSGKVYDITNEADLEEYSKNCDIEGFTANAERILGTELFNGMFKNDDLPDKIDDEYEYEYTEIGVAS